MSKIEYTTKQDSYLLAVIATSFGHRCGYVGIQPSHPLHSYKYYDSLPVTLYGPILRTVHDMQFDIEKTDLISFAFGGDKVTLSLLLQVHGGVTFAGFMNQHYIPTLRLDKYELPYDPELWFFGFDCNHYMDAPDPAIIAPEYKYSLFDRPGVIRTLPYCIEEVHALAKQLSTYEKLLTSEYKKLYNKEPVICPQQTPSSDTL